MKIRMDFVSNSSSSSFVFAGYVFTKNEYKKHKKKIIQTIKDFDLKSINRFGTSQLYIDIGRDDEDIHIGCYSSESEYAILELEDVEQTINELKKLKIEVGFENSLKIQGGSYSDE